MTKPILLATSILLCLSGRLRVDGHLGDGVVGRRRTGAHPGPSAGGGDDHPDHRLVRVVGGDYVDVYGVLKPNVDPHDYEPTPADLDAIAGPT